MGKSFLRNSLASVLGEGVADTVVEYNIKGAEGGGSAARGDLRRAKGLMREAQISNGRALEYTRQAQARSLEAVTAAGRASHVAEKAHAAALASSVTASLAASRLARKYSHQVHVANSALKTTHLAGTGAQRDVQRAISNAAFLNSHHHHHRRH
eukprot:TRINITY_DN22178_c0_g1_i1.p1 TRINITY_DN22178_c0_g1~~TRINITY_DN22178_c0_g1_i1.p1  ORF type:complete len:154 (+),score=18.96 TRINITY_DN22178_c0_g1_i1:66-527(+)